MHTHTHTHKVHSRYILVSQNTHKKRSTQYIDIPIHMVSLV